MNRRIAATSLLRRTNRSRTSSLAMRSASRWRSRCCTSCKPCRLSGGGRSALPSIAADRASTVGSPVRVWMSRPRTPRKSPRSSDRSRSKSAPITSRRNCACMAPVPSRRSRKATRPMLRTPVTRPVTPTMRSRAGRPRSDHRANNASAPAMGVRARVPRRKRVDALRAQPLQLLGPHLKVFVALRHDAPWLCPLHPSTKELCV